MNQAVVHHIYISPGHNYRGHHGRAAGDHPILELDQVECVAGQGLRGDRFFAHQDQFKGQVTFFDWDVYRAMQQQFDRSDLAASAMRRNVLVAGVDLNALIDREFQLQGIRFAGSEECAPCYWMNQAIAPGAEEFMKGRGGLRARILTTGILRVGPAEFEAD